MLAEGAAACPRSPRWLLAIPDAIRQLEALDRDLLPRRDVERLFGVSLALAAQLMRTFGAELVGYSRVLRRTDLLRQLRELPDAGRLPHRGVAAHAGLPEGVTVEAGRIEVRFADAKEAVGKLYALAQALTGDYERFEALVGKGKKSG